MSRITPVLAAIAAAVLLLVASACGGDDDEGTTTLRWYVFNEPSGAFASAARACSAESGGRYRIAFEQLPAGADAQREQLVRRLAAEDSDIDIIGMDVIWTAEFAAAGWIEPWSEEDARAVTDGAIESTVETARWDDALYAAPFTTNAQLLWYRKDRVAAPPRTWDEMIDEAERIGPEGTIQVQGARYEGLTVWFASLVASAGGAILTPDGKEPALGPPAVEAARIMRRVASSPAAPTGLPNAMEDQGRLGFETGDSTFMVNYTFVYPSAKENAPKVFRNMAWARWPRVDADRPSRVTLGGINLGVGAYGDHKELAFEAVRCLVRPSNQVLAAQRGGLPPTADALYEDPAVREAFPFWRVLRDTLRDATARPATPAYNDVSLAIQTDLHPAADIEPERSIEELRGTLERALASRGLL